MFRKNLISNLNKIGFFEVGDTKLYFKNIKNIGYFVCPLDVSGDLSLYYDDFFPIIQQLNLDKIYFLYILSGEDFNSKYGNLIEKEIDLDAKIVKIYWGVDTNTKQLLINENQPSKLVNIEDCVMDTINNRKVIKKSRKSKVVQSIPYVTYFLIMLLISIHISVYKELEDIIFTFGLAPNMMESGQYYRLLTSMFLHVDIQHLISNCLSLYIFGSKVERYMGTHFLIITYVFSGLCGALLSMLFTQSFSVGASGAIFGIEGALLYFAIKEKTYIDGLDVQSIFTIVFMGLIFGFAAANVDNAGHIGGFVFGIIASIINYISFKK